MGVREKKRKSRSAPRASTPATVEAPPPRAKPATELATKVSASVAVVAAIAIAMVVNVLAVRHYHRWDFTKGGLFTLSAGTVETLHGLSERVNVIVLLSNGDPLEASVEQILQAYAAETSELEIQYLDPDKRPAEFIAAQQKYDLSTGRSEDGRVVADASIIVTRGDRHHFVTPQDLVAVDDADDMKARPRLEQAITGAIRSVLDDVRQKVCVTTGHGEHSLEEGGDAGLLYLRDRLVKNNFDVASVFGDPGQKDPLAGCNLLILAAPTLAVPKSDADAMTKFVEGGGSALLVAGPVPSEDASDYVDLGLSDVFALAGVKLERAVVFETDAAHRFSRGYGEVFYPDIVPNPVTNGLLREEDKGTRVVLNVTGALSDAPSGAVTPLPLLKSTEKAVGVADFFGWARDPKVPEKGNRDLGGPFTLAVAAERAKKSPSDERGPRVVAVGCPTLLFGVNWREPHLRGNALFVESAVSWLGSHRAFLDIPNQPSVPVGVRLTEDAIRKIFIFTVGVIPGLSGAIGVYVYLLRRRAPKLRKAEKGA